MEERNLDLEKDQGQKTRELSSQLVSIVTTEHYNLQTGRAMTISDTNGRASLFLGTVSSTLVALAFVGQISQVGTAFFVFSLVLFPTLFFLGLVTFERVLQSGIEDIIYARGINRIRHLYLEYAPQMHQYFILSSHDDDLGTMRNMGLKMGRGQSFLTMAGMMAVINSVIAGAFVGLLLYAIFRASPFLCAGVGMVAFALSVLLHQRYQWSRWEQLDKNVPVVFPSSAE